MTKAAATVERTAAEKPTMRMEQTPSVGRVVHYYDREEVVNADQQKRAPEPFGARITRVHKDQDGQPLNVVNLAVDDPEIGQQIRRDVAMGEDVTKPEAHRWYWPPYTPPRGANVNRLTMEPQTDAPAAAATGDGGGTGTENAPAQ